MSTFGRHKHRAFINTRHFFLLSFCLVDQLPCGSVLTPAISCTKFKIHSANADSPMAETEFSPLLFLGRTSLCLTDQETQEENLLGGPTPLWVGNYTSYFLYKVQDPFSACRQSHGRNRVSSFTFFREDQSLLHRPRHSGRECAWWTNSLVGQYLHQLVSCTKFKIHSVNADSPWPKQGFLLYFFQGGPVFASQTKKHRKRFCLVDQLPCGSVLTPAISCTKFKIHSAHADSPMAETGSPPLLCLGRTSLRFTDQETQEENVLGGPTPFWVSTYTSYLLYKV